VFLSRNPINQYAGRHGETEQQVMAVEALIDYQVQVGQMLVPLYFWLLDAGKYGIGIMMNYWEDEIINVSKNVQTPILDMFGAPTGKMSRELVPEPVKGYSGNKLINVRPYDYYPDPRVPLWDVQRCEFVAYLTEMNWLELARGGAS